MSGAVCNSCKNLENRKCRRGYTCAPTNKEDCFYYSNKFYSSDDYLVHIGQSKSMFGV